MRLNKRCAGVAVVLGLLTLSGCSQINKMIGREETVDYKSTVVTDNTLSIPPDLTQANTDVRYRAPEGATTYSQYEQNQAAAKAQDQDASDKILPQVKGMSVMRDGNIHWLVADQPAQDLYPKIVEFWGQEGFTIHSQDPKAGLIQTDWAENRAKIPEGWLHSLLGKVLDQVFDSGERDRFRTRIERVDGKTEIYISHQHMVQTPDKGDSSFKWVYGKEDQGLNAAMLARLMVYLGTNKQQAQTLMAQAEKDPTQPTIVQPTSGQAELTISEPFDRAWRRVGIALDSAEFSVDDRDRSAGDYYISYLDTDTGEKIEQQTFFGRLFGTKNTAEATKYRLHVAQQGAGSVVTVLDKDGKPDNGKTAQRIITVLSHHMGSGPGS